MSNSELHNALHTVGLMDFSLSGNESFIRDTFSKVGGSLKDGLSVIGSAGADKTIYAFKSANTAIIKNIGTRRLFLSHLISRLGKEEIKEDIKFNDEILSKYTLTGNVRNLDHSLDKTIDVFSNVLSYVKDVEAYYHKELSLLSSITNIKTTEQAVDIIKKLDDLKHPTPKDVDTKEAQEATWILPGGRGVKYSNTTSILSFVNLDIEKEESSSESFAKEDFKSILVKLNKLVDIFKSISDANNHYVDYIKKFNTVVGKASEHLASLRGEISPSLLSDLVSRLEGNTLVFTLYSGFLPKAVIYLDDYVGTLSSYLSKQFN